MTEHVQIGNMTSSIILLMALVFCFVFITTKFKMFILNHFQLQFLIGISGVVVKKL